MLSVVVVGEDKTGWRLAERTGLCLLGFHMRSMWNEISNKPLDVVQVCQSCNIKRGPVHTFSFDGQKAAA